MWSYQTFVQFSFTLLLHLPAGVQDKQLYNNDTRNNSIEPAADASVNTIQLVLDSDQEHHGVDTLGDVGFHFYDLSQRSGYSPSTGASVEVTRVDTDQHQDPIIPHDGKYATRLLVERQTHLIISRRQLLLFKSSSLDSDSGFCILISHQTRVAYFLAQNSPVHQIIMILIITRKKPHHMTRFDPNKE